MSDQGELLEITIERAQIGWAELDAEGRFVSVNSRFLSMLEMLEPDLLGQHWYVAVHPEDYGRAQEAYRAARTDGRSYVEIRALRKDSGIVYHALTLTGVMEHGVRTGYTCMSRDISHRKRKRPADQSVDQNAAIAAALAARRPAFLANRWADLEKMRDALATGDFAAVETIGHNCKGIGVGYGFPDITKLGSAIETAAKAADADVLSDSLQQFETCILKQAEAAGARRGYALGS